MPLRSRLPSSGALFMFEAAARHRNFTLAAREFNVTQPAISRMILRLEQHLGAALFLRRSTGLELTEEGRILHRAVRLGFDRIEEAVCEIQATTRAGEVVALSVTSAFALPLADAAVRPLSSRGSGRADPAGPDSWRTLRPPWRGRYRPALCHP
jgi:LysR family glycine cleavage system transcriptional activator